MRFRNPVIPGFYPDPSVCRVGDDFYLVTSTFEYFPGVPIFHSRDLVHWRQLGHCLSRPEQLDLAGCPSSKGIYAPTLRYHDGTFYMVTTHMGRGYGHHFYVTAKDPSGPWSDPIWIEQYGIDPSFFFDDDGKVYFTTNGKADAPNGLGIYQSELDLKNGCKLSAPQLLWAGTGGMAPEGPHLYKVKGIYYLLLSEGGTSYGHMVTLARSQSPFGPFEPAPNNPILSHRSLGSAIHATGHADWVELEDGSFWAVFLGIRPLSLAGAGAHHLGRETFLAPVTWDADGWPRINAGAPIELEMEGPSISRDERLPVATSIRDEFEVPELGLHWNFLRGPAATRYQLANSQLHLYGNESTLDELEPALIGQRQRHLSCEFSALLAFEPVNDGEEAGLFARMSEGHHYEIAIVCRAGEKRLVVRKVVGSLRVVALDAAVPVGTLLLKIRATPSLYFLEAFLPEVNAEGAPFCSVPAETRFLSSEMAGTFTGVYLGLYATGNGKPSVTPALFDFADYRSENSTG